MRYLLKRNRVPATGGTIGIYMYRKRHWTTY